MDGNYPDGKCPRPMHSIRPTPCPWGRSETSFGDFYMDFYETVGNDLLRLEQGRHGTRPPTVGRGGSDYVRNVRRQHPIHALLHVALIP